MAYRDIRKMLVCTVAAVSGMHAASASAQERQFDVPGQVATRSIPEFARQAGIQIIAPGDRLRNIRTREVKGVLDVSTALSIMLQGSGLRAEAGSGNTLVLRPMAYVQPERRRFVRPAALPQGRARLAPEAAAAPEQSDFGDIVVTAQRRSERQIDVPLSIAVVGGESLAARGVANTLDLKQAVPGVQMNRIGTYLQPSIRGISTTVVGPGFDANVAIYVDGVYQSAMAGNVTDLPDVDRIEVLKGPQGTLFGRNATGGAIQIFTRQPSFDLSGQIDASLGVYAVGGFEKKISAYVTGPIAGDSVAGSLTLNWTDNDGYMHNDYFDKRLGFRYITANPKLLLKPADNLDITISGNYSNRNDYTALALVNIDGNTIGRALDPTIVFPSGRYHTLQNFLSHLKGRAYGASIKAELQTGIGTFSSLSAYRNSEIYLNNADSDASPATAAHYINPSKAVSYSEELTFASEKFGPLSIIGGLYLFKDKQSFAPFQVVGVVSLQAKNKTDVWAAFSEVTLEATDRLSIIGGLRYSHERRIGFASLNPDPYAELGRKSWNSTTPRVSVKYALNNYSNIYATYSEGFKSGGFDTLNFSPVAIDPETIKSYEIGYKLGTRNLSLNASAFYYDYKNQQVGTYQGFVVTTQNAASSKVKGFELSGIWRPEETDLTFEAGIAWLPVAKYKDWQNAAALAPTTINPFTGLPCTACGNDGVSIDASGFRFAHAPKLTGNFAVNYDKEFSGGTLGVRLDGYYSSAYNLELTGRLRQGSYLNLGANVSWTSGPMRYMIWARNLTDNRNVVSLDQLGTLADSVNYVAPFQVGASVGFKF